MKIKYALQKEKEKGKFEKKNEINKFPDFGRLTNKL